MDIRVKALASLGLAGSLGVILYLTLAGDQPIYWNKPLKKDESRPKAFSVVRDIQFEDKTWQLRLEPGAAHSLNRLGADLTFLAFGFGLSEDRRRQELAQGLDAVENPGRARGADFDAVAVDFE